MGSRQLSPAPRLQHSPNPTSLRGCGPGFPRGDPSAQPPPESERAEAEGSRAPPIRGELPGLESPTSNQDPGGPSRPAGRPAANAEALSLAWSGCGSPGPHALGRSLRVQEEVVENEAKEKAQRQSQPRPQDPGGGGRAPAGAAGAGGTAAGVGRAYVMSLCRGGRCTFRTTHFTIHSMPSRTPWLWRQWGEEGPAGPPAAGWGPHSPGEGRARLGQAVPPADLGGAVAERRLDVGDGQAGLGAVRL